MKQIDEYSFRRDDCEDKWVELDCYWSVVIYNPPTPIGIGELQHLLFNKANKVCRLLLDKKTLQSGNFDCKIHNAPFPRVCINTLKLALLSALQVRI